MVKVILEAAENGIIKKIIDDNHGGSNEQVTSTTVHEFNESNLENVSEFLYDICEDLNIYTGSKFGDKNLEINIDWGMGYDPSNEEINKKISKLKAEIELLKSCKK